MYVLSILSHTLSATQHVCNFSWWRNATWVTLGLIVEMLWLSLRMMSQYIYMFCVFRIFATQKTPSKSQWVLTYLWVILSWSPHICTDFITFRRNLSMHFSLFTMFVIFHFNPSSECLSRCNWCFAFSFWSIIEQNLPNYKFIYSPIKFYKLTLHLIGLKRSQSQYTQKNAKSIKYANEVNASYRDLNQNVTNENLKPFAGPE